LFLVPKLSKFRDFRAANEIKSTTNSEETKSALMETNVLTPSLKKKTLPRDFIISKSSAGIHSVNTDSESRKVQFHALKKDKIATHPFRHLIFGPEVDEKTLLKHLQLT
jgi:hypothetical protein